MTKRRRSRHIRIGPYKVLTSQTRRTKYSHTLRHADRYSIAKPGGPKKYPPVAGERRKKTVAGTRVKRGQCGFFRRSKPHFKEF